MAKTPKGAKTAEASAGKAATDELAAKPRAKTTAKTKSKPTAKASAKTSAKTSAKATASAKPTASSKPGASKPALSSGAEGSALQCISLTKAGDRCRNKARAGSPFCGVHASQQQIDAVEQEARVKIESVAEKFNVIAEEVSKEDPAYEPPPYSPDALLAYVQHNMAALAKYVPNDTIKDIVRNLEGTTKEDLMDPQTWQGLWYILNYSMQENAKGVFGKVSERLAIIPGMDLVMQFTASVMESPRDLLDLETWKGAATILNAAVSAQVSALKDKLLGTHSDE